MGLVLSSSYVTLQLYYSILLLAGDEALLGGVASLTVLDGTSADGAAVDSAADAVALLEVELGEGELLAVDGGGLRNIASRGLVEDVADDEATDSLILGGEATAVEAVDGGGAATGASGLGTTVVAALGGHDESVEDGPRRGGGIQNISDHFRAKMHDN